jgi:hypothetical protein
MIISWVWPHLASARVSAAAQAAGTLAHGVWPSYTSIALRGSAIGGIV